MRYIRGVLSVHNLSKQYGTHNAVVNVNFQVATGEIVGFLGPNGAGKTTTLRMLTGYLAPSGGSIEIDGLDVLKDTLRAKRRIGYMPEGVPAYRDMRVVEYLRYRAALKGVRRKACASHVEDAMRLSEISEVGHRIIGQLSRGFRQRLGLADALVADPPFLVLDEPTAGLDPNQIRHVRALVRRLAGRKTILISTHILPEVEAMCERVLILHKGKLVAEGRPGALIGAQNTEQLLLIEARGKRAELEPLLWGIEGVRRVLDINELAYNGIVRARVETDPSPQVAERVFQAAADAGLVLRELRNESASLEDVFAELTTADSTEEELPVKLASRAQELGTRPTDPSEIIQAPSEPSEDES
ncbi:MAG: ATP-binding cassette domain-containing protein [Myxococcales bacterium]|nr:ATP-binding cassette domain-containing protein [Myxococcales bacterium]